MHGEVVVPKAVLYLQNADYKCVYPALKFSMTVVATPESKNTQLFLDSEGLEALTRLLHINYEDKNDNFTIRREVCYAISNIMAGPISQVR